MPSQNVRLSVRPSVCHTPVLSLNSYTYPQSFSPSGSPTILAFPHQTGWQYSHGNPLMGASNVRGYEKITIFDQYLALSRKLCKTEPYLLWKTNRKLHPSSRMVPCSLNDLEWPLTQIIFKVMISFNVKETQKRYQAELYLQWWTNTKSYMINRTAPFSMILNNP